MLESALKLLKKIEDKGFEAYIVGGFVRDYILGLESADVDITTNATPKDIREIFKDSCLAKEEYGSVTVIFKNIRFEITTYREEYTYLNNRKPIEFKYIDSLEKDLKRRDFLINTICMNSNGEVIDLFNARKDIENRVINTVGDPIYKFSEDVLRILRAVRFATVLNFKLSEDVKKAILVNKNLLKNLSYSRKREELDKIFTSPNVKYGVSLICELGLDKELELFKLIQLDSYGDLLGIWARLDIGNYPFTKNEKEIIKHIEEIIAYGKIDNYSLYKYGLYINMVYADIKNIDKKQVVTQYNNLPIKLRQDIDVSGNDIINLLDIEPSDIIKTILDDLEQKILCGTIENKHDVLINYIEKKYKKC